MTRPQGNSEPSLRSALETLSSQGIEPIIIDDELDPNCEIAQHYLANYATSPAHSRSGPEPMVLYTKPKGHSMPVLMGLFGDRDRCEHLLGCDQNSTAARLIAARINSRIEVEQVPQGTAPSQAKVLEGKLDDLPVLTVTNLDAGPYLTSGLVVARDPISGCPNVSIHRMRVIDRDHLTIWMLPGRDLDRLYQTACDTGKTLPVSINIGVAPVVYITSSITSPFLKPDESELEFAGAINGHHIGVSPCMTQDTWCLAESEIVIEGEITGEVRNEYDDSAAAFGMPEFLGYMGMGKPSLPVVRVSRVTTKTNPIYQTFLGPGKEQSELLGIPAEAGMFSLLAKTFDKEAKIHGVHYLPAAGGQLFAAIQIEKRSENRLLPAKILDLAIEHHSLLKAIFLVDPDVNIQSESDLIWAMATRFQPSRDLYCLNGQTGFPLDPSQAPGYQTGTIAPTTDKYLMDFTVPVASRDVFQRVTELVN